MIAGIFHEGSGLGNQLHRYVATRVLALDKGYDFSMVARELFKGSSFMSLDMGFGDNPFNRITYKVEEDTGKVIPNFQTLFPLWEERTNYYNPEFNFIEDDAIIDGEFQDERYFGHRLGEVNEWLKVEPLEMPDDVCVIGFRGGEFAIFPELFLPKEYFIEGIKQMRAINPAMKFQIHTDDRFLAEEFFNDVAFPFTKTPEIIQNMEINWRSMRYAKYAIVANSSFFILPRLLAPSSHIGIIQGEKWTPAVTIAPRYWARHNIKEWSMPQNYYKAFTYIHV